MKVTSTTPAGLVSSKTMDTTGKVIAANDNGGELNFKYDSRGNQIEVKQGTIILANFEYDAYGKQTKLIDKNAGTTTYEYDAYGQLTMQKDANNNVTTMQYDDLGRVTTRAGAEGNTIYEYYKDIATGCTNNNPTKITSFSGVIKEYQYDNLKRPISEKETIDGTAYTTSFTYNNYNQLLTTTYPSGFISNNVYDANGYVTAINGSTINDNTTMPLFSNSRVDGEGKYSTYKLVNGIATTKTYDNDFAATTITPGIQSLSYNFQQNTGNLLQRSDNIFNQTEIFTYDNLNRLTKATVNGTTQFAITYDANGSNSLGNITTKTDAGYYKYHPTKINAVEYINYTPSAGQANANPSLQSAIPTHGQQITYTSFLRPATITESQVGNISFTYGDDYERVKTAYAGNNGLIETRLFMGDYEIQNINGSAKNIHYISGPDGICGMVIIENGIATPYAVYTDYLGSINTLTDKNAVIIARQNFDAWGRKRLPNNWNSYYNTTQNELAALPTWLYRGFTGHEMLPLFALINMNARLYDPILGRMLSPDNYVSTPYGTQVYNRYSYANNNPLVYTDPDGNFPVLVAALIGGFIKGMQYDMSGKGSFLGGFWRGAVVSAASAYVGGVLSKAMPGLGGSILSGTTAGIVGGGLAAALDGTNILSGISKSGFTGGVGGGISAYFGGGTGALIGGVVSGGLGSALNGEDILKGALIGGTSSFVLYHLSNYYNYSRSQLKSDISYKQFSQISGDYQRSTARRKEFAGVAYKDGSMDRVNAANRHNTQNNLAIKPAGRSIALHYHTHWAKPNLNFMVDANGDFTSNINGIAVTTTNGPSEGDLSGAGSMSIFNKTIVLDRLHFYSYNSNSSTIQPNYYFSRSNIFAISSNP